MILIYLKREKKNIMIIVNIGLDTPISLCLVLEGLVIQKFR